MLETSRIGGTTRTGRRFSLRCRMLIPSAGMTRIRFDGSAAWPPLSPEKAPRETFRF